tara:strand:- start:1490 stop:2614 length:1125 start_codon:yes stop_codon:yes gene_type:complete
MIDSAKKIAIVVSSLSGGGAEKASANLSIVLRKLNCEVHMISILDKIDFQYAGKLLNLGKFKDIHGSILGKFKRFLIFKRYLREEKFNLIIDSRSRPTFIKEFLIQILLYNNQNVIYIIHSYFVKNYLPENKFLANLLYRKAHSMVAVSEEIKEFIDSKYKLKRLQTVHNCIVSPKDTTSQKGFQILPKKFILFFGRIEDKVKNISLLIESYAASQLASKDIYLVILGNGPDVEKLKHQVKLTHVKAKVVFIPFQANPIAIVKKAFFSVLSSRYEGSPMSLVESLALGVPVVSVDCKSGPREIINSGFNGLLVENHNPMAMAKAFDLMVEDKKLYKECCNNASMSVQKFSVSNISKVWKPLLTTDLNQVLKAVK